MVDFNTGARVWLNDKKLDLELVSMLNTAQGTVASTGNSCGAGKVPIRVDYSSVNLPGPLKCVSKNDVYPMTPGQRIFYFSEIHVQDPSKPGKMFASGVVVPGSCQSKQVAVKLDGKIYSSKPFECLPDYKVDPAAAGALKGARQVKPSELPAPMIVIGVTMPWKKTR